MVVKIFLFHKEVEHCDFVITVPRISTLTYLLIYSHLWLVAEKYIDRPDGVALTIAAKYFSCSTLTDISPSLPTQRINTHSYMQHFFLQLSAIKQIL